MKVSSWHLKEYRNSLMVDLTFTKPQLIEFLQGAINELNQPGELIDVTMVLEKKRND